MTKMPRMLLVELLLFVAIVHGCVGYGGYFSRHEYDSSEEDNTMLRTYRRCMWEQSRFLPRRLVLLSLCSNHFCENNQPPSRYKSFFFADKKPKQNDCLDVLTDQCVPGDEEELMYKPFPECCPVYCNLKRRVNRLKMMHLRHRRLLNMQRDQSPQGAASALLQEYGINFKRKVVTNKKKNFTGGGKKRLKIK